MRPEALGTSNLVKLRALEDAQRQIFGDARGAPNNNATWMKVMPPTKRKRFDLQESSGIETFGLGLPALPALR